MDFCGGTKKYTDQPIQFDPLADKGGQDQRAAIYKQLGGTDNNGALANWNNQATGIQAGATTGANDAGWNAIRNNARTTAGGGFLGGDANFQNALSQYQTQSDRATNPVTEKTLRGDYLQTPAQLAALRDNPQINAIRQATGAQAADQGANIRDSFSRNGVGFSTGNQQAQQANAAASGARANETIAGLIAQQKALEAQNYATERANQAQAASAATTAKQGVAQNVMGAKVANYGAERANQNNAGNVLGQSYSAPLSYLSQALTSSQQPLTTASGIVKNLSAGGQVATPQTKLAQEKGYFDYLTQIAGLGLAM